MAKLINPKKFEKFERLPLKKTHITSFFISIFTMLSSLVSILILPPEIPLFYGFPQGGTQISSSTFLFIPSLIAILVTTINAYISIFVDNIYLKRVLAFTSILISILSGITTFKIIFLVGNL